MMSVTCRAIIGLWNEILKSDISMWDFLILDKELCNHQAFFDQTSLAVSLIKSRVATRLTLFGKCYNVSECGHLKTCPRIMEFI